MPGWTLVDTHPTLGRTFQRPLDVLELWLFWDGRLDGATDGLQYFELRLLNLNGPHDADRVSEGNVVKAWLSTKRRYPLAGASVRRSWTVGVRTAHLRSLGDTTVAKDDRDCDIPVEDGKYTGWAHSSVSYHTFDPACLSRTRKPPQQAAMTRVLYRKYLRGEISEEEWAYRKRQLHICWFPLDLRPRLDKAFERGGGGESIRSVGLLPYQLPFC
ncbi:hypothetical protein L210DRAFT_3629808 [Boletus edulis BED1]|uniref:Uncharacterized protein n=1 Tax=Boletus edulis BED1 TaxID=1328754 RepID=A0AAD4BWT4_BOLED|nr:hypothetical protein L210DRAFT_3629808 [Boletus edulis BED1]